MAWSQKAREASARARETNLSHKDWLKATAHQGNVAAGYEAGYRKALASIIKTARATGKFQGAPFVPSLQSAAKQAAASTFARNANRRAERMMAKSRTFGAQAAVQHRKSADAYLRKYKG